MNEASLHLSLFEPTLAGLGLFNIQLIYFSDNLSELLVEKHCLDINDFIIFRSAFAKLYILVISLT